MVNEFLSASYRLLKPEYQTAESSGSNASVSALWCWRIDNGVWGVPYQSMGAMTRAPASASLILALANQAYTILLCASCASDYGAVPSSGSTKSTSFPAEKTACATSMDYG